MTNPDGLDEPAFPYERATDPFGAPVDAGGLTKLQWASVQIAAAMIAGGSAGDGFEDAAVRIAVRVLTKAAP